MQTQSPEPKIKPTQMKVSMSRDNFRLNFKAVETVTLKIKNHTPKIPKPLCD